MTIIRIEAKIDWKVHRASSGGWLAVCDSLRLTTEGDTWDEVVEMICEIQQHLFQDLFLEGELPQFLREHGWTPAVPVPVSPDEDVYFDVPFDVIRANHADEDQARSA